MAGTGAFWCPAMEPRGRELEKVVHSVIAQNIFCTHHTLAVHELSALGKRGSLPGQSRPQRTCTVNGRGDGTRTGESPLSETVAFLVRSSGVGYDAEGESPSAGEVSAASPAPCDDHHEPEVATSTAHEVRRVDAAGVSPTPSALAALIEAARARETVEGVGPIKTDSGVCHVMCPAPPRSGGATADGECRGLRVGAQTGDDGGDEFGVSLQQGNEPDYSKTEEPRGCVAASKHPLQMTREEFLAQYKRAPRRGEIGYDAESVAAAESLGYVMSGSRNREKQHYVDSIQQKLHEKEARKLRLQFRKVEDERNDSATVETLLTLMRQRTVGEVKKL
ncbi:hypothetical protein, conserved [Trypanosoma brucei gambiense DAL972]|uniref:NF-kappa-B-activating protein C-terminal domain-containing protein n=2 Tax=Trypanosoma brucei TaxID=5691 RepID=D0A4R6_TRYB9|nr:hypothetical protein, conserved [Trypanosoma brucei gambiense DAL972]CBH16260.1 hypothetical protein, conserved [Trypanosoma brucei gambiense DAL972]|eukprot:XP_011778524.1 hypothetical protein, conserved [Trypanosoma brucei gambiense DAL972]